MVKGQGSDFKGEGSEVEGEGSTIKYTTNQTSKVRFHVEKFKGQG